MIVNICHLIVYTFRNKVHDIKCLSVSKKRKKKEKSKLTLKGDYLFSEFQFYSMHYRSKIKEKMKEKLTKKTVSETASEKELLLFVYFVLFIEVVNLENVTPAAAVVCLPGRVNCL